MNKSIDLSIKQVGSNLLLTDIDNGINTIIKGIKTIVFLIINRISLADVRMSTTKVVHQLINIEPKNRFRKFRAGLN